MLLANRITKKDFPACIVLYTRKLILLLSTFFAVCLYIHGRYLTLCKGRRSELCVTFVFFSLCSFSYITRITPGPKHQFISRDKASFYDEQLLAPRPSSQTERPPLVGCPRLLIQYIPKLKDHHLSAVRDCLFNIFPN